MARPAYRCGVGGKLASGGNEVRATIGERLELMRKSQRPEYVCNNKPRRVAAQQLDIGTESALHSYPSHRLRYLDCTHVDNC